MLSAREIWTVRLHTPRGNDHGILTAFHCIANIHPSEVLHPNGVHTGNWLHGVLAIHRILGASSAAHIPWIFRRRRTALPATLSGCSAGLRNLRCRDGAY